MGQKELSELAEKLRDDQKLRALFVQDPEAAAREAGIALDEQDHQALRDMGAHEMDEDELETRVSKAARAW